MLLYVAWLSCSSLCVSHSWHRPRGWHETGKECEANFSRKLLCPKRCDAPLLNSFFLFTQLLHKRWFVDPEDAASAEKKKSEGKNLQKSAKGAKSAVKKAATPAAKVVPLNRELPPSCAPIDTHGWVNWLQRSDGVMISKRGNLRSSRETCPHLVYRLKRVFLLTWGDTIADPALGGAV